MSLQGIITNCDNDPDMLEVFGRDARPGGYNTLSVDTGDIDFSKFVPKAMRNLEEIYNYEE